MKRGSCDSTKMRLGKTPTNVFVAGRFRRALYSPSTTVYPEPAPETVVLIASFMSCSTGGTDQPLLEHVQRHFDLPAFVHSFPRRAEIGPRTDFYPELRLLRQRHPLPFRVARFGKFRPEKPATALGGFGFCLAAEFVDPGVWQLAEKRPDPGLALDSGHRRPEPDGIEEVAR